MSARIGDLVVRRHYNPDGEWPTIEIVRADPKIRISLPMMLELLITENPAVKFDGDILTITATNRNVVYLVGDLDPSTDTYPAEWPD